MRQNSGIDVLLSAKERREVLGRIGGVGGGLPRISGGNAGRGGVMMPATGASRPAARQCWKERKKAADAQVEVRSVLRPRQQRMGLPG